MGLFFGKKKREEQEKALSAAVVEAVRAEYARTKEETEPDPVPQRPMRTLPGKPEETAEYLEKRQAALIALERQEPMTLNAASEQLLYELCAAAGQEDGQEIITVHLATDEAPFLCEVEADFSAAALQKYLYFIQYLLGQHPGDFGYNCLTEANGLNPAYPKLMLLGQAAGLVSPFVPEEKLGAPCISLRANFVRGFDVTYAPGDPEFKRYRKSKPKELRQLKETARSLRERVPAPSYDNYPLRKEIREMLDKWHTLYDFRITWKMKILEPFFSDEEWEELNRLKESEREAAFLARRGMEAFENKQYKEALALCGEAASYGDPDALCQLGDCYYKGKGVHTETGIAMEWYRKADTRGSLKATYQIGYMYLRGHGVKKDWESACHFLERAALAGYADAQLCLAKGCFSGAIPYHASLKKGSIEYLRMAAAQGNLEAMQMLAEWENR